MARIYFNAKMCTHLLVTAGFQSPMSAATTMRSCELRKLDPLLYGSIYSFPRGLTLQGVTLHG